MPALTPAGLTLTNLPGSPANLARKAALHVHAIVFRPHQGGAHSLAGRILGGWPVGHSTEAMAAEKPEK